MKNNYFEQFSDKKLIKFAEELNGNQYFTADSKLREAAIKITGNDSLPNIISMGVHLSKVLADRLKISSPHVF